MKLSFAALALVVVSGCAASTSHSSDTASSDVSSGVAPISGSFDITGPTDDTIFNKLTLDADGTFQGTGGCRQDLPGVHCFAITSISGKWRTLTSGPQLGAPGGAAEMEFTDQFGQKSTYFYTYSTEQLTLSKSLIGDKSIFKRAAAPVTPVTTEVPDALYGSFSITGPTDDTIFNKLTLNADSTFDGTGGCRADLPGPHCGAITSVKGTWRALTSGPELGAPGGAAELEFTDQFGQKTTYFYKLANDQLSLSKGLIGDKSTFEKSLTDVPAVGSQEVCADANGNTVGRCGHNLACEFDGPGADAEQRCLPQH